MKIRRRHFARLLGGTALTAFSPLTLFAQGGKTLKVMVGYAPGGAADVVARAVGEGLRTSGYTVIVENKAGASGRLAIESMLTAPADGSVLLMAPVSNLSIYPHIYRALRYDPFKDLVPVASASSMSFGLAVGASSPAKTLQEFLARAKKDPAMGAYGTPGAGTPMHFLGAMLARQSQTPLTHVPYKGGSAALTDAIGGSLPAVVTTLPNLLPMHRAGKLRILAITNPEPQPALADVPTFKSAGFPELTMAERFGFFSRSGLAAPVLAQLNADISAAVKSPAVVAALQKVEFEPSVMTAEGLDKYVRNDYARWGQIVKTTGYTAED